MNPLCSSRHTYLVSLPLLNCDRIEEQFSTSVPQEFFKHAMPDYLIRGTDLFSFRLSNKKMTTANTTIAISVNDQNYTYFLVRLAKRYFLV